MQPAVLQDLQHRWSLEIGTPYPVATCSWVAPVACQDGSPAVLKIGTPHMEALHEIEGLQFWNGDPTVRIFKADETRNALLIERCDPGTPLSTQPEPEQDRIIAQLLLRLWRIPPQPHPFRPLEEMIAHW